MVEVNNNTAKHAGKHLQHHPAQESSRGRRVSGRTHVKKEMEGEKNKLMTGDNDSRRTMATRE